MLLKNWIKKHAKIGLPDSILTLHSILISVNIGITYNRQVVLIQTRNALSASILLLFTKLNLCDHIISLLFSLYNISTL